MKKTSDCFEAAGRAIIDLPSDAVLVHACVDGQGPLEGRRFVHAWIEIGDVVVDKSLGKSLEISKRFYYAIGCVRREPGQFKSYTRTEALHKMLEEEHFGPWEKFDESNPYSD